MAIEKPQSVTVWGIHEAAALGVHRSPRGAELPHRGPHRLVSGELPRRQLRVAPADVEGVHGANGSKVHLYPYEGLFDFIVGWVRQGFTFIPKI
jgi:hypothetical protein